MESQGFSWPTYSHVPKTSQGRYSSCGAALRSPSCPGEEPHIKCSSNLAFLGRGRRALLRSQSRLQS